MALPSIPSIRLPLLEAAATEGPHSNKDLVETLAGQMQVREQDLQLLVKSGAEPLFANRVRWAKVTLRKAGLLEIPTDGFVVITDLGRNVLSNPPAIIDNDFLKQFPGFVEWLNKSNKLEPDDVEAIVPVLSTSDTPIAFFLTKTLNEYSKAKLSTFNSNPFAAWFRGLSESLPSSIPLVRQFIVESSVGFSGNWAYVPWVVFRRPDIAPSVRSGIYVAYLFSSDMSKVYLSLNQGVSSITKAGRERLLELRARAEHYRSLIALRDDTAKADFPIAEIDLKPGTALAKNYEAAHIIGKVYERDAIPDEPALQSDLARLLSIYSTVAFEAKIDANESDDSAIENERVDVPGTSLIRKRPYTFHDLRNSTLWTGNALESVLEAIIPLDPETPSRQILLAGPPGTGKTWVAKQIALYASGNEPSRTKIVQFHQSYAYEQFVEGLQPVMKGGQVVFDVAPGIVRRIADECRLDDGRHFLIVDEMNRANVTRVFGELMYLFEYRDEQIELPYSGGFVLPPNLGFIATMNTADRSTRGVDLALRRRFDVFECQPDVEILQRFYSPDFDRKNYVPDLYDGFVAMNERLTNEFDRFHTIGQTFFMRQALTPKIVLEIWNRQISPTLNEYFFDQPELLGELEPTTFWPSLATD